MFKLSLMVPQKACKSHGYQVRIMTMWHKHPHPYPPTSPYNARLFYLHSTSLPLLHHHCFSRKKLLSHTMQELAKGGFDHPVMRGCVTVLRHRYLVSPHIEMREKALTYQLQLKMFHDTTAIPYLCVYLKRELDAWQYVCTRVCMRTSMCKYPFVFRLLSSCFLRLKMAHI